MGDPKGNHLWENRKRPIREFTAGDSYIGNQLAPVGLTSNLTRSSEDERQVVHEKRAVSGSYPLS